ncbi:MAG: type VI secretion system contractile sheath large subunit [Saccharospirillum sp.]|uniref:type VI secretion system contractile sheath large subunit n=1 Tax=Saccharospirillum sp. TaxID=2033801 RepID=UPI00329797D8
MTEGVSEKINLVYRAHGADQDEELPFRILVLSALNPTADLDPYDAFEKVQLTSNDLSGAFASFQPELTLSIEDEMLGNGEAISITLSFLSLSDFEPESLFPHIPGFTTLIEARDNLSLCLDSETVSLNDTTRALLDRAGLLQEAQTPDSADVSRWMAELDTRLNSQMNVLLHHPDFQRLESAWRSLDYLVGGIDFHENALVDVVNLDKETLRESFEDTPEITQSPLYQLVYSSEFGQFGGKPYSLMVGDYLFDPNAPDIQLLQNLARVAAIAHAPYLGAVSARFFGLDDFREFSRMRDLNAHFQQPGFEKWQSFRQEPDARYMALCMPRFLLREAYAEDNSMGFSFYETYRKQDTQGVWGNAAFALAERVATAFSRYRWFVNMVGEDFGVLPELTVSSGRGAQRGQIPTEVLVSDRRENDLVHQGFVPLTLRKGKSQAGFYSAASVRFHDIEGTPEETIAAQLDGQMPYILIACRFAQYLKVMQREHIGSWKTRAQIDQELTQWLRQYVSDMDNPAPGVRARRPLRSANLSIREVEGKAGWYMISMELTPHFKFLGQPVTLRESGRLEKS